MEPAPVPTSSPRQRDPLFDNGKFVLIVLVVVGHYLEAIDLSSGPQRYLYLWIYSFHMPAFAIVSGYLSRSFELDARRVRSMISTLVLPYLVFQLIQTAESWAMGRRTLVNLADPQWTLWFLMGLFGWRLLTPLLRRLRHPLAITVLVSLASGIGGGVTSQFGLNRMLAMLPFFTLGLVMTPERWAALRTPKVRIGAGVLLALALAAIPLVNPLIGRETFYWRHSYHASRLSTLEGVGLRLGLLLICGLLALALWSVVPGRRHRWSERGQASLYVYLLHAALYLPVKSMGLIKHWDQPWQVLVVVAVAVSMAFLLSTAIVRRVARPLVEPPIDWLLTSDAAHPVVRYGRFGSSDPGTRR